MQVEVEFLHLQVEDSLQLQVLILQIGFAVGLDIVGLIKNVAIDLYPI
jgi:hypothetical protein